MFTKLFWKDATERALSTAAQFALGVIGLSDAVAGVITQNASWELILSAAATGFILSLLKAIAAAKVGNKDSASFAQEV